MEGPLDDRREDAVLVEELGQSLHQPQFGGIDQRHPGGFGGVVAGHRRGGGQHPGPEIQGHGGIVGAHALHPPHQPVAHRPDPPPPRPPPPHPPPPPAPPPTPRPPASASVSPASPRPPGTDHPPAAGPRPRRTSRIRSSATEMAPTQTSGWAIEPVVDDQHAGGEAERLEEVLGLPHARQRKRVDAEAAARREPP